MAYTETALYVDSVAYTAVVQWAATHAYTVGQIVRQLAVPAVGSERCFICIVAGTSLSTEPAWVLTRGAKTTEAAGPTWMECTGLPALCADNTSTNAWHATAGAIALGWIIKNVANDHYFICTTAGTGGTGTEPTWNTTTGATTTDNTVTWTCIGATSSFTTKWAAAHARLAAPLNGVANWLLNVGMIIFVGDDHAETSSTNMGAASQCSILCVDHTVALPPTTSNLKTTASVTLNTNQGFLNTGSNAYVYGLQFPAVNGEFICSVTQSRFQLEKCTFTQSGGLIIFGSGGTGQVLLLKDCTFSAPNIASSNFQFQGGAIKIENGIFTAAGVTTGAALMCGNNSNSVDVTFEGCDFTGVPNTQYLIGTQGATGTYGKWLLKDCSLSAGMQVFGPASLPASDSITVDLNRVDGGATAYRNERYRLEGLLTTATGIVRTGGASDGATLISHQITTNANTNNIQRIFNSVPFATWNAVTGANRNVTIYGIANDSRVPNNDELWFDAEYLGSAISPKGSYARGGKANVLAAGSALTADTSAWDVPSVGTLRNNSSAYNAGDIIKTASNASYAFYCTTAGTSAVSEPASVNANTLNPADVQTMTLSNGNLTATPTGASAAVRSASVQRSGKFYFEGTITGAVMVQMAFGLATNDVVNPFTGMQHGVFCQIGTANAPVFVNNVNIGTNIGSFLSGNTLCVAVDLTNKTIWFRINAGNWNGSGTANPATNTGGVDISSVFTNQPAYAVLSSQNGGGTSTINLGGSSFAQTVPSGFSAWNVNSQPTVVYADADQGDYVIDGTAVFLAAGATTALSRQNSWPYVVGNYFKVASNPGRIFFCTVAGTSAGSEPGGYASAVDGGSVTDGGATFRAGCRFRQTITLSSPQPGQAGYLYVYPKTGRPSMTYYIDPMPVLS